MSDKLFVPPALGEFGCFVGSFVRQVWSLTHRERSVVVGCPPGSEWLFPKAEAHFTDYDPDFIPARYRNGHYATGIRRMQRQIDAYLSSLAKVARHTHGCTAVQVLPFGGFQPLKKLTPVVRPPRYYIPGVPDKNFVAIAIRCEGRSPVKNVPASYWCSLLDALYKRGLPVVLLGRDGSSAWLEHPAVVADTADIPDQHLNTACAIIIQQSNALITTDSGMAHLADVLQERFLIVDNGFNTEAPFLLRNGGRVFGQDEVEELVRQV